MIGRFKPKELRNTSSPGPLSKSLSRSDRKLERGDDPRIIDHSVNAARAYIDGDFNLILESSIRTNDVGNFNGGGSGNKPIASLIGYVDYHITQFPTLESEVELRSSDKLGLSFNALIDLKGQSDPNDYVVMVVTNTLDGDTDKYGFSGSEASVTQFDINNYYQVDDESDRKDMRNEFYIVGNLPSYTGATQWFANPINLDILLNGGTMPITGEVFSEGFPNARLVSVVAFDGGHPRGTKLGSIMAQIGDSSNNDRVVTAITSLKVDGDDILNKYKGL